MKKGLFFSLAFVLVIILTSFFVLAQEDSNVDRAYSCLKSKVENNCAKLSHEEIVFSLLALAYDSDVQNECKDALEKKADADNCWPSGACTVKSTAQAIIALNYVGEDTSESEEWLLKNTGASDLIWYLQIDTSGAASCSIKYDDTSVMVTIGEDKKISGNTGSCLSLAYGDYWLQIASKCFDKNFTISCDSDFSTNLLYKKKDSNVIYVSSETKSAPADGKTEHKVKALCFKKGTSCDYEATLWATLALAKTGHDISAFVPYLTAYAKENEKLMSYAFLYILTGYEEYLNELVLMQKQNKYWMESDNKYYDTALALLALQSTSVQEAASAKEWLLSVQTDEGCWHNNNIRDTGFLLYAGWPKEPSIGGAGGKIEYCNDYGYYCAARQECTDIGGEILENYFCDGMEVCCSKQPPEQTCEEKGGIICSEGMECTGALVEASDTTECCMGSCVVQEKPVTESECEIRGYTCRFGCLADEIEQAYECDGDKVCCAPTPREKKSYWWIWLLIILIILTALAIVFRNKLQIWFFKMRKGKGLGRGKPGPKPPTTPTVPAVRPKIPMQRTPVTPRLPRQPMPRRTRTDKELEETLKKLREISK